ncbi:MAG: CPBP family intramembrane metalloprotease [Acidobacteria bacterium]|nr:CPBP family intramembrane metalloprotease [Acidobacteriota bacterium]
MEPEQASARACQSWTGRLQAFLEVLLLAGLVSSFLASLPFGLTGRGPMALASDAPSVAAFILLEASIVLLLLLLLLHMNQETLKDLGMHRHQWISHLAVGAALVPVLFLVNALVALCFKVLLPKYFLDRNPLIDLIRTPKDLAVFLLAALYAGGIKEELQRAFILNRFRDHLGGAWFGLVVWSIVFGAGHYVQGPQGVVAATIFGLLFGGLYLVRRSLLAPLAAHALYDTTALLGYWFFSSGRT